MPLQTIYVVRHGYRSAWSTDRLTGLTTSTIRSPTGIPSDPPLTAYGVQQATQLGSYVSTLNPAVDRIYSSAFYRCLQTVEPSVETLEGRVPLICDRGLGEWFGLARFRHPPPAPFHVLQTFFPTLEERTSIVPAPNGESLFELHNRCAYALASIIADCDTTSPPSFPSRSNNDSALTPTAIIICTHAAVMIAIGRALTGRMPEDVAERDFHTFTASVSRFERVAAESVSVPTWRVGDKVPDTGWKARGVAGGWRCVADAVTEHLEGGEERDWGFSGDESFMGDSWGASGGFGGTADDRRIVDTASKRSMKL